MKQPFEGQHQRDIKEFTTGVFRPKLVRTTVRNGLAVSLFKSGESTYYLGITYEVMDDGKGTAYAKEVWEWCQDRGIHPKPSYEFMQSCYIGENVAMEFKMRWM